MSSKKGEVKVSIKNENDEVFVDYRGEGDLIGYLLIFGGGKARATVVAVNDTICYLIKREPIQNLLFHQSRSQGIFSQVLSEQISGQNFQRTAE